MRGRSRRRWRAAAVVVAAALALGGCVGLFASHPCSRGTQGAGDSVPSGAELRAAMDRVAERAYDVPGVGPSWVDEEDGRLVFEVASGDDGGASTCAALADVLDETGLPYDLQVFDAPTERLTRTAVAVAHAWAGNDPSLDLQVASCNGLPEVTVLEETAAEVSIEVTATVAQGGWMSQGCIDNMTVPLRAPLGERTLTDLTTGEAVSMYGRAGD